MRKPIVVIADVDEKYLAPLELKFIEELYEKVELEIISDLNYLNEYFSIPRTIDILVMSEELYTNELQKHNILNIFLLTESLEIGGTQDLSINKIFKYTSTKEIFNEITYNCNFNLVSDKQAGKETQVVLVYSASGGSGKTTVSLGISSSLAQNHKKVLYINAENIQSFQNFLINKAAVSNEVCREMKSESEKIYFNIKHHIRKEGFDYLPPFSAALSSLNIKFTVYQQLIKMAKASKDYDFIVVDVDSVFNDEKAELLSLANKVIILVGQDRYSVFKTEILLENINCNDNEKYIFICNAYKRNEDNAILDSNKSKFMINEYIDFFNNYNELHADTMFEIEGFQKIAYMLI